MKTVGEILKRARVEKNLDYEAVEKKTRIRKKFLEALEDNDWSRLPSPNYIKGFIRNYSSYLGLKGDEMVAIFRRQYTDSENAKLSLPDLSEPLRVPLFKITPQRVVFLSTFLFIFLFIFYLFSQYLAFTGSPMLSVTAPKEGEVFTDPKVVITGTTDKDAQVFINNQKIDINDEGAFKQEIILNPGINQLTIESQSKMGKKSKVTRTIQIESP